MDVGLVWIHQRTDSHWPVAWFWVNWAMLLTDVPSGKWRVKIGTNVCQWKINQPHANQIIFIKLFCKFSATPITNSHANECKIASSRAQLHFLPDWNWSDCCHWGWSKCPDKWPPIGMSSRSGPSDGVAGRSLRMSLWSCVPGASVRFRH